MGVPLGRYAHDDLLDVGQAGNQSFAANQRLLLDPLQIGAAGIRVVLFKR